MSEDSSSTLELKNDRDKIIKLKAYLEIFEKDIWEVSVKQDYVYKNKDEGIIVSAYDIIEEFTDSFRDFRIWVEDEGMEISIPDLIKEDTALKKRIGTASEEIKADEEELMKLQTEVIKWKFDNGWGGVLVSSSYYEYPTFCLVRYVEDIWGNVKFYLEHDDTIGTDISYLSYNINAHNLIILLSKIQTLKEWGTDVDV